MIDTRTLRTGDTIVWPIWTGELATAKVICASEFRFSIESPDGYSQSIDHHWVDGRNHYSIQPENTTRDLTPPVPNSQ